MIVWLASPALAEDLAALARSEGFAAVHDAVGGIVAATKEKKRSEALVAAGLSALQMPVTTALGADLVLTDTGPAQGCTWTGSAVTCTAPFVATATVAEGEYQLTCRSRLGATAPVPAKVEGGAWRIPDLLPCWKLDGATLVVTPVAGSQLEGVGQGTDTIPPELVGLTKRQVDETIGQHTGEFRHCLVSKGRPGLTGKLVLDYHIGADGHLAEVTVGSSTLGDAAVEGCVVERFRAIVFPRPNDGYDRGQWPVTFQ